MRQKAAIDLLIRQHPPLLGLNALTGGKRDHRESLSFSSSVSHFIQISSAQELA